LENHSVANPSRTLGVESARKVLQILLQFAEHSSKATIEELASSISASVSSTYRYVSLLREVHLIEEVERGSYALSPRVLQLGRSAHAAIGIGTIARPVLNNLTEQTGETALLVQQLGDSAVCVESSETDHALRLSFSPGQLLQLHRGAAPKVLLANLPSTTVDSLLKRVGLSEPERKRLDEDLEQIREIDLGFSFGEVDIGVWAAATPVRIAGKVVAAISVAAPTYRLDETKRTIIVKLLQEASATMSAALT
jgi:DNA-binding IclR family transcriptional regulator